MSTREAVIVSVARTPIGKAYRGAFNDTEAPALSGHATREAIARAGVEPALVEDVIMGCSAQQGTQGYNIGRLTAASAGLPDSVPGMTVDRMCSSGLMAVSIAAKQIIVDGMQIVAAGGVESISLTQNKYKNSYRNQSETALAHWPPEELDAARRYSPQGAGPVRTRGRVCAGAGRYAVPAAAVCP